MAVFKYKNGEFDIDNSDAAFIAMIREVVKGKESFVYEGCPVSAAEKMAELESDELDGPVCLYVHRNFDGTRCPGCMIGQVLIKMGVPLDWFEITGENSTRAKDVMHTLGFSFRIRSAAQSAQDSQDYGLPWHSGLSAFESTYERLGREDTPDSV